MTTARIRPALRLATASGVDLTAAIDGDVVLQRRAEQHDHTGSTYRVPATPLSH